MDHQSAGDADEPARPRNRILALLPVDEFEGLRPALERVRLETRQVVVDVGAPIEHVYFPETAVVSIVSVMPDGSAVETATVGHEGMVGIPVFLGAGSMAAQAFAQVPGDALRMSAGDLRAEVRRGGVLPDVLGRYTQALFTHVAQSSACNRLHPVEQRCARWLLATHDAVGADSFEMTHLFLSQMLGVRRATVTEVAGRLQNAGLIEYGRGRIRVVDRPGLEAAACECYGIIRSEFARLMDGGAYPSPLDGVAVTEGGMSVAGDGTPRGDAEGEARAG